MGITGTVPEPRQLSSFGASSNRCVDVHLETKDEMTDSKWLRAPARFADALKCLLASMIGHLGLGRAPGRGFLLGGLPALIFHLAAVEAHDRVIVGRIP
jgi:hypothetical protein